MGLHSCAKVFQLKTNKEKENWDILAILLPLKKKKKNFFYIGYLNVTILVLCLKKIKIKITKQNWTSRLPQLDVSPLLPTWWSSRQWWEGEWTLGREAGIPPSPHWHGQNISPAQETVPAGLWFDIVPWRAGMPCKSPPLRPSQTNSEPTSLVEALTPWWERHRQPAGTMGRGWPASQPHHRWVWHWRNQMWHPPDTVSEGGHMVGLKCHSHCGIVIKPQVNGPPLPTEQMYSFPATCFILGLPPHRALFKSRMIWLSWLMKCL